MTTADVTAEEIEGAPLLINPQVKEVKPRTRSRLNLALCIVLAIDTLLQLIAIVTPGWNVQSTDISSCYESVYYTIVCADTTPLENVSTTVCHSRTFLNDFSDVYNVAKDSQKPEMAGVYNLRVRYQINIQISWFIVAGATVFQIIRYIRARATFHRLTAINAMVLICACTAMYQSLYEAIVTLDVTSRQAEYLGVEVGFPYSVFLYAVAFMQTCICTVVVVKQIYDYTIHIQLALKETKVQVNTLQQQYKAQVDEFRHYRESERTRLRGRIRKPDHAERNSRKGSIRRNHSARASRNSDRSLVQSEGDQDARYIELMDISSLQTTEEQSGNERNDSVNHSVNLSRRTSDLSDVSRDSFAYSKNHNHSRYEPQIKPIQQASQPLRVPAVTKQEQIDPERMRKGYSSAKENRKFHGNAIEVMIDTKTTNMISDKLTEEDRTKHSNNNKENVAIKDNNKESNIKNVCECTSDGKPLQTGSTRRIVSADVHIPNIDDEVIED